MRAFVLTKPGVATNLELKEIPSPQIADNELLIRTRAISINPVDVKTREGIGFYAMIKDNDPLVLGWDISGIVEKVGKHAGDFKVGDEVFGMVNFPGYAKAYAELVAAPASQMSIKPSNIGFGEAAASTLAALTAYQVLVKTAKIKSFQKILISAASGGVGHFAAQLAKHLGAYVIGSSSENNREFVLSLGVDEHVNYKGTELENLIGNLDFALDAVGGENTERLLPLVKKGGMLVTIPTTLSESALALAAAHGVDAQFLLVKSNGEDMAAIAALLSSGVLKPYVSKSFPFEQLPQAHLAVETGRSVGKVVVILPEN